MIKKIVICILISFPLIASQAQSQDHAAAAGASAQDVSFFAHFSPTHAVDADQRPKLNGAILASLESMQQELDGLKDTTTIQFHTLLQAIVDLHKKFDWIAQRSFAAEQQQDLKQLGEQQPATYGPQLSDSQQVVHLAISPRAETSAQGQVAAQTVPSAPTPPPVPFRSSAPRGYHSRFFRPRSARYWDRPVIKPSASPHQ